MAAVKRVGSIARSPWPPLSGATPWRRVITTALVLGTLVAWAPAPAFADDETQEADGADQGELDDGYTNLYEDEGLSAKQLLAKGKEAMAAQDFAGAERALARAAELERSYSVLGNLGQVEAVLAARAESEEEAQRWWVRAATHLSESIRAFPVAGPIEQRSALERKLTEARGHVVTVGLEVSPASTCAASGERELGCGPFQTPLYLEPGDIVLELRADGHASKRVRIAEARRGSQHTVKESLTRTGGAPAPAPTPQTATGSSDDTLAYVAIAAGGLGLVAGVAGGVLWKVAGDRDVEAAELLADGQAVTGQTAFCRDPSPAVTTRCADIRARLDDHDTMQRAAVGLFVSGGVLVAGAAALLITHQLGGDDAGADVAHLEVTPVIGAGQGGLVVGGRW